MTEHKKKMTFAKTYQELEKIVNWFEQGEVDVEVGIEKFEAGMKLAKELKTYLNETENKIKELKKITL
jgi:exodeoxyribonuclease VII small subunit